MSVCSVRIGTGRVLSPDNAWTSHRRIGLDTSPFIYFIERHPVYVEILRPLFRRIDGGHAQGFASVVTLAEVLTRPIEQGNEPLQNQYRELLLRSRNFTLLPVTASLAQQAAALRARYRLRTPDALVLATALQSGCEAFVTNDRDLTRVSELRVLVLADMVEGQVR